MKIRKSLKRSDLYASYFAFGFVIATIIYQVGRSIIKQELTAPVGLLLGNQSVHIPLSEITAGQATLLAVALGVRAIAVLVTSISVLFASHNFLRGDYFAPVNARYFKAASVATVAYIIGIFVQGIAHNWIAFGAGWNGDFPGDLPNGIGDAGFIPAYILTMVFSLFAIVLTRASQMQEDQEGLI